MEKTVWHNPTIFPLLSANSIHIWKTDLNQNEQVIAEYRQYLSQDEQARADRFLFDKHRNRYTVARGVLRKLLARYLNLRPNEIEFNYTQHGKPQIAYSDLKFNVSHSHEVAVYVFNLHHEVGVDCEQLNHKHAEQDLAQRFFAKNEYQRLIQLPESQRHLAFFNLWTRKEAFIKAIGLGLSYPLNKFEVSFYPDEEPAILAIHDDPAAVSKWSVAAFKPTDDYVAAVVVEGAIGKIEYFK